jgi:3',5'-cyclic AMP phosphodiesterase CpdA
MRIAIVADIHGNLTAAQAVIADLQKTSPDLVVHAGDLATHGHRPADVIDLIREHAWPGVYGNTDDMLWTGPEALERHIARAPKLRDLMRVMFLQLAPATCERLGAERLSWLRQLPAVLCTDALQVLRASPGNR